MKLYRLCCAVDDDSVLIDAASHEDVSLFSGSPLPRDVALPFRFEVDGELPGTVWPTMFLTEAVFRRDFVQALQAAGVSNIEVCPAKISGASEVGVADDEYVVLNIIGRIACVDFAQSEYDQIGEHAFEFDHLVIDSAKVQGESFFRLHESTATIVVARPLVDLLSKAGFADVFFEEIVLA